MRSTTAWFVVLVIVGAVAMALFRTGLSRRVGPYPIEITKRQLSVIAQASKPFHVTYGSWPTGFAEFYSQHNSYAIAFLPPGYWTTNDGWRHPFIYRPFDAAVGYGAVISLGRDGKLGGIGEDGDIEERFR